MPTMLVTPISRTARYVAPDIGYQVLLALPVLALIVALAVATQSAGRSMEQTLEAVAAARF